MKVRLKQDFLGYPEGTIVESVDGMFNFKQGIEDISERESSKVSLESNISEDYMYLYTDTFEVLQEEPVKEIEVSSIRSKEQIEAKLASVVADSDILKSLDYKYASRYIQMLDNMAYMLEWVLGKVE